MTSTPSISPLEGLKALSEANTDSLSEVFSRDAFQLTKEDITRIVMEYRSMRSRWDRAEAAGKRALPKEKSAVAKVKSSQSSHSAPPKDMEF